MILSQLLRPNSKDKIYCINLSDSVVSKINNKLTNYGIFNGTCPCLGYRKFNKCKHLRMYAQKYRGLNTTLIHHFNRGDKNLISEALTRLITSGIIAANGPKIGDELNENISCNLIKIKAIKKLPIDYFYYILVEKKTELPILIY